MTTLNNAALYTGNLLIDLEGSFKYAYHEKKKKLCEVMEMLNSLTVMVISQCLHIAKHQIAYLKYTLFFLSINTSIKVRE